MAISAIWKRWWKPAGLVLAGAVAGAGGRHVTDKPTDVDLAVEEWGTVTSQKMDRLTAQRDALIQHNTSLSTRNMALEDRDKRQQDLIGALQVEIQRLRDPDGTDDGTE